VFFVTSKGPVFDIGLFFFAGIAERTRRAGRGMNRGI
jgi:hypothetical protein